MEIFTAYALHGFLALVLVGTSIQSSIACAAARLSLAKTHPHAGRRLVLGAMNLFGWGKYNLYPLPAAAQGVASRLDHGGRTKGPLRPVNPWARSAEMTGSGPRADGGPRWIEE